MKGSEMCMHMGDRLLLTFSLFVPSIILICIRNTKYLPGIYIGVFYAQLIVFVAIPLQEMRADFVSNSMKLLTWIIDAAFVMHCLKSVLKVYQLMYGLGAAISSLCSAVSILSAVLMWSINGFWLYVLVTDMQKRTSQSFSQKELRSMIYMLGLTLMTMWYLVAQTILWPVKSWSTIREELLVAYLVGQIMFTLVLTGDSDQRCCTAASSLIFNHL